MVADTQASGPRRGPALFGKPSLFDPAMDCNYIPYGIRSRAVEQRCIVGGHYCMHLSSGQREALPYKDRRGGRPGVMGSEGCHIIGDARRAAIDQPNGHPSSR